jgi:hypothetical protein
MIKAVRGQPEGEEEEGKGGLKGAESRCRTTKKKKAAGGGDDDDTKREGLR